MSDAGLEGACLRRAHLAGAILRGANLRGSDLRGAHLRKAILFETDMNGADLVRSNLSMADLRLACLEHANLRMASLYRANLIGARLAGACLDEADLAGAILPDGTLFTDETNLSRFTDAENPAFAATLTAVIAMGNNCRAAKDRESAAGDTDLSWSEFVERTYGSLADDPIDLQSSLMGEYKDSRE